MALGDTTLSTARDVRKRSRRSVRSSGIFCVDFEQVLVPRIQPSPIEVGSQDRIDPKLLFAVCGN